LARGIRYSSFCGHNRPVAAGSIPSAAFATSFCILTMLGRAKFGVEINGEIFPNSSFNEDSFSQSRTLSVLAILPSNWSNEIFRRLSK
jgi:hypothetical protein